ncbi:MAG: BamA/TamA family outer membrane protein, partial [Spirulinaceae cyanobacterium RM2_2_10]|nr:BamA/TamA family outer membrane protein [Spirulinaceae cyanobacterium RM2_2_10]
QSPGGVSFGDVPVYETFNLGGNDSVRGFESGKVGSDRGFVQASLEYRLQLATLALLDQDIGLGAALFKDHATTLQTDNTVIGQPASVRQKPGEVWG